MTSILKIVPAVLALAIMQADSHADIAINSVADSYAQDFNTLPNQDSGTFTWTDNSTLDGWYRRANNSNMDQAADTDLIDYAVKGANVGAPGFYNVSTAGNTDRAVGFRVNGDPAGLKKGSIGLVFENKSGTTLTGVDVSYTGEQWYRTVNDTTLFFQWRVVNSFDDIHADIDYAEDGEWHASGALSWTVTAAGGSTWQNGSTAANSTNISGSISGMQLADGQKLIMRWRIPETSENKAGLMIDDVQINNWQAIPEPATLGMVTAFGTGILFVRRFMM